MVHPPGVNTPFYNHAVSHMPEPVHPPPPVYQPEVIADAISFAATNRRREVKVTAATVGLAIGNKIAPGLLDFFAGSGTTGAAALETGRSFILVDSAKEAIATMKRRFADRDDVLFEAYVHR